MTRFLFLFFFCLLFLAGNSQVSKGFFDFTYSEKEGKILLDVKENQGEFLYVNYLSSGLGSNDIGLDRGQIGDNRVVEFVKYGNKLFLIEKNLEYRAISENVNERNSVEEAFASSVLYAFPISKTLGKIHTIDISSMLLSDSHEVSKTLKKSKEGSYKVDKSRSAILPEYCKSFPENTEFRSMITFGGSPIGKHVKTVVPTPESITLRMHHSFVKLPDSNYKPRKFHPESGYFVQSYKDYAVPIEQDMTQRFITRHRLEKTRSGSTKGPIIYYIDKGCPDPIKTALMEGARWWNQAFEAAGFMDAFQVKELPEGADPLDVRYNMIQWVHRSTRGWSYGGSVVDPRTGEILKGHVSLGSLRVRQDYLIMQALMSPYDGNEDFSRENPMTEIALARLRQLAAHEVGHTIGLSHNFAASADGRASVMDYPHPQLKWTGKDIDFSAAYDDKIGEWDKQAIKYGYSIFENEETGLQEILKENKEKELSYISDSDARPQNGAHPKAHLWDNGKDIVKELNTLYLIRNYALNKFGEHTITKGTPYSELEKYMVPLYMMHRYQLEGAVKLIGGVHYTFDVKSEEDRNKLQRVAEKEQEQALAAILKTLEHEFLAPEALFKIPPSAQGYNKSRESVKGKMGPIYDPLALAASNAKHTFQLLLTPERLNRIAHPKYSYTGLSLSNYFHVINSKINENDQEIDLLKELFVDYLISAYQSKDSYPAVKNEVFRELKFIEKENQTSEYLMHKIDLFMDGKMSGDLLFKSISIPPGSPIGCNH